MRNYEELLKAGNAAQLEKLKQNEHKSGFDDMPIQDSIKGIEAEAFELYEIFYSGKKPSELSKKELQKMRHEAADIANYCHMLILKIDKEIENEDK